MNDINDDCHRYKSHSKLLLSEMRDLQNQIQQVKFDQSSCVITKMALEDELQMLQHTRTYDLYSSMFTFE
jgi:hypothetical protein